jgi:hypothetical protein
MQVLKKIKDRISLIKIINSLVYSIEEREKGGRDARVG